MTGRSPTLLKRSASTRSSSMPTWVVAGSTGTRGGYSPRIHPAPDFHRRSDVARQFGHSKCEGVDIPPRGCVGPHGCLRACPKDDRPDRSRNPPAACSGGPRKVECLSANVLVSTGRSSAPPVFAAIEAECVTRKVVRRKTKERENITTLLQETRRGDVTDVLRPWISAETGHAVDSQ